MSTDFVFRTATIDDIDGISRLWNAAGLGGDDAYNRHEITVRLREDDGFFVVGAPSGETDTLRAVVMGCNDNHRGWIQRVAVDPAVRGRGMGGEALSALTLALRDAGVTALHLEVDRDSPVADFYGRLGFRKRDRYCLMTAELKTG